MAYIKDSQSYHFSAQAPKRDVSLPVAIVIAVAVHAIIFGIGFSMGKDPAAMMQDVAKALTDNMQPNETPTLLLMPPKKVAAQWRSN
ncbi:hypothetical protein [Psychrobacter sp. WY6]|uniref:hypothetical protein n=1 Tax=Psychrobacter sp. WY6 TaxID=2708350 RepID=UPI002023094E|nr:hypothetical protein [Psychrobacter sp. WY6]